MESTKPDRLEQLEIDLNELAIETAKIIHKMLLITKIPTYWHDRFTDSLKEELTRLLKK